MSTSHAMKTHGFSEARAAFERDGYYLYKGLFSSAEAQKAADWLRCQDLAALAKSWTEQEPAVPLAVYSVVHESENPVAAIARDKRVRDTADELIGAATYIWASKVNLKAAWCGTAEYYHQDLVYWKDRGYPRDDMLSCMVALETHSIENAALHVLPGTHRLGFIPHEPFININGLSKFMVPPSNLDLLYKEHGIKAIKAEPGDALFFHSSLVHGSSHNISPHGRMVLLVQMNTVGNEPVEVSRNAREFNLKRAEREMQEADRRYSWFKDKYDRQKASEALTFSAPIPKQERGTQ
jgi:ectoine hydroxylase-related dioxygenase (phytanoyl-CoA dioxygenase family)